MRSRNTDAPRPTLILSVNAAWNVVNFRMGLIRFLQAEGFRVIASVPEDGYAHQLREAGVETIALDIHSKNTSPIQDLRLLWRYWRILRRVRPAAFLGYTAKPNIYGSLAAWAAGVPAINNISGLGTAFIRRNWVSHVVQTLYRLGLMRSRTVFFQNDDDRQLFLQARLVREPQTRLLPGSGIDLMRFQARPLPDGPVTFLLIGRLILDKGVGEFVEAARRLVAQSGDVRFQLLGFLDVDNVSAISRADIDRWQAEGTVTYLGETDDVRPFIEQAHCVVLPSYREGTPKTLLEAAAMGRPLVATDVPGCREVVNDGVNGFLCEVRDAGALSEAMGRIAALSAGERAAMGQASRNLAETRFDDRIVFQRYAEAIAAAIKDQN